MATASCEKRLGAGLIFLLLSLCSGCAGCRRRPDAIIPGVPREGALRQSDRPRTTQPRGPEARWQFDSETGGAYTITAESYEFDLVLLLLDPEGRQIASGNGNGELFSAVIARVLPVDGRYTVVVCGSTADQFGAYWISLERGLRAPDWSPSTATAHYERGRQWAERANSARAASWTNLLFGRSCAMRNRWDEAEKYFQLSLSLAEQNKIPVCIWAATLARGRLSGRRRHYEQAFEQLQRALSLTTDLQAPQDAETITLVELGKLSPSSESGDLTRSSYYRNAAENADRVSSSTRAALYTALSDFLQFQDREKAYDFAEKAFAVHDEVEPVLDLEAMHALAGSYLFIRPEKSAQGLQLVAEMRERAHQMGCPDEEVAALILMSMAKAAKNEVPDMVALASEALTLISPEDEDPNRRRVILQLLADGEFARQNFPAALSWCSKALQTVETAWARQSLEEARRELLSQAKAVCTQIIATLNEMNERNPNPEYARQAFDYAERSRSRLLLEQLSKGADGNKMTVDPLALRRDQELIEKISEVHRKMALVRSSAYPSREQLYALQEKRVDLMAERMRLRAEITHSLGNPYLAAHLSPLDVDQAQKEIAMRYQHSAILYYQLAVRNSFLIIVTPHDCRLAKLPDWTVISKAVEEWTAAILNLQGSPVRSNFDSYVEVASRLYGMLIRPAERFIRGRQLIIVPSDALCRLAFEALVIDKSSGQSPEIKPVYLVQRHAVSYAPSVSVLAEIDSKSERRRLADQILLLGDVQGGPKRSGVVFQGEKRTADEIQRLPAARDEVLRIAELAGSHKIRPTIWLGPEANEARFKAADLSEFRFIHIATHGIADHRDGEASALTLSPDPKQNQPGLLTSDEVSKLRLDADLVVLSGCETSVGEETGAEGIVGFNRTFLIAGARCVCGSLWQVEDSWTERLMTAFYQRLMVKHYDKSESLRLAKLAVLKEGANPSQWAPFVLVGSYR